MNGDAYFQRGLEGYWIDREKACSDLLKGISLGAKDTSMKLVKERAKTESFLDELFTSQKTLVDACKDSSDEKIEKNKQNYESENFRRDLSELLRNTIHWLLKTPELQENYLKISKEKKPIVSENTSTPGKDTIETKGNAES